MEGGWEGRIEGGRDGGCEEWRESVRNGGREEGRMGGGGGGEELKRRMEDYEEGKVKVRVGRMGG